MSAIAWEIVVGIETHAQLLTRSKIFSGASTAFGAEPNTQASAVDIALPGVLPVLNAQAVELAVRFGIAVGANINRKSIFARKNYFYPDLPKGYQISQYEIPVVQGGSLKIVLPGGEKTIRLTRAHLEEDAGKSLHDAFQGMTGIDLNRAGTPLLEIVTEPELRGAKEAVAYARAMHALVRWIGICDGNMQEGSFRCDANVSVRKIGDDKLGTRCEIKNLNSFRFMEHAIEFEARRQIELIEGGKSVTQETRLYDPDRNETRSMRSKEDAQDYRYFPDPDLLPLVISDEMIKTVQENLSHEFGPLPDECRRELTSNYGLSLADASALTGNDSRIPHVFRAASDEAMISGEDPTSSDASKLCANWVINEYMPRQAEDREKFPNVAIVEGVSGETLGYLVRQIRTKRINASTARKLFQEFWDRARAEGFSRHGGTKSDVDQAIETRGLGQISDSSAIEKIIDEVLAANVKQVEDYRAGREKAFNSLVGQVMKRTQGKANPAQVNEILRRKLAG
jgi:aspartyl-tRNA(Asn)/glutamyl-tRNA(Gln) amidotransferase subunit B